MAKAKRRRKQPAMFRSDEAACCDEHKDAVQLRGAELRRVRAAAATVLKQIEYVARVTFRKIGYKPSKPGLAGIGKIIIKPPNRYLQIFYDQKTGKCAGVWEDPPGICRPCNNPDSSDGHDE